MQTPFAPPFNCKPHHLIANQNDPVKKKLEEKLLKKNSKKPTTYWKKNKK